ncbi:MAG: hypothetical protein LBW77_03345, partial [Verrucomicrobiota bacterium]|nr:hypothetical protein [Verrucomicrobiota bacterium]
DLLIDAAFDADQTCWNITYSITNGPGGIVLSDKMLYEAPEIGYVRSVSVTVTNVYDWPRYLYVNSRTPTVYSRVLFFHNVRIEETPSLRLSCKVWTNPYGERNLEQDERSDSVFGLLGGLESEAKAALASGKYPEKPDMDKRVKEAQAQVKKETDERMKFYNSPEFKRQQEENDRINREAKERYEKHLREKNK